MKKDVKRQAVRGEPLERAARALRRRGPGTALVVPINPERDADLIADEAKKAFLETLDAA
jgi:hypothetical protein